MIFLSNTVIASDLLLTYQLYTHNIYLHKSIFHFVGELLPEISHTHFSSDFVKGVILVRSGVYFYLYIMFHTYRES